MSKTKSVIKQEIADLEKKLTKLHEELDRCTHAGTEVDLQVSISNATSERNSLKRLLKLIGGE